MTEGKRILIIDADEVLTEMLTQELTAMEGFLCTAAHSGAEGLSLAENSYYDLVILDVELPEMGGREVCRRLRAAGTQAPIIMLTAADSDTDTIRGLNAGATDYVAKPFKLGVLVARIRAHIRQFEHSDEAVLGIGPFDFRPGAKMLQTTNPDPTNGGDTGHQIRLTDKESQILKFLYLHGDRVVSRDELLDEVWGYNAGVTTHTLETHVYRLRQKMEPDPSHAEILITESGGYRLVP
ncbi:MAG: response regulator transcription factor [Magnetovibrio sp.]|nr:response regulator transcription factor [Magnetovibrio sp.]